ncbi:hypothetical protein GCM10010399_31050 [Dactylosporangium fulvum]
MRAGLRWIALVAVALTTLGVLAAATPSASTEPVFTFDDFRVLNVEASGDRLIIQRYQPGGAGTRVEVLSLRDGTRLWSMGLGLDQHLTFLTDNVMALTADVPAGSTPTLTVLDAATGERLWQRTQPAALRRAGGRILAEDATGVTDKGQPAGVDLTGEILVEQHERRYLALDERTGATVWEVRVPRGSVADFSWFDEDSGPGLMFELSPTGLLRIRDLDTGAVIATHQLDWSGTVSGFTVGDLFHESGPAVPDKMLISKAGERGMDVYDRGTGRLLWRWQDDRSNGSGGSPYPCAADLFCLRDESGLTGVDPGTGEQRWHLDRYTDLLGRDGDILVLTTREPSETAARPVVTVDARTGRVVRVLEGWRPVVSLPGGRLVSWRRVDDRTAVLGVVDPRSGRITVIGRSNEWYGQHQCLQRRNMLVCVVDGVLSAWRLP